MPGWMTPDELQWLYARAADMNSVCEIGVMYGRSATAFLIACDGPVYCVDPWAEGDWYGGWRANCGHFDNLREIREYSPAAASAVPDIDMTFIDGSHEYDAVHADIVAWLPKTRRLLCGHDYGDEYPGVRHAVHELLPDALITNPVDLIWAVDLTPPNGVNG